MRHHLAQINIARFIKPVGDPVNAEFVSNLARINALAEAQPGFVWRLVGSGNDATDVQPYEEDPTLALNMSVWTDVESLVAFTYRDPGHRDIMKRRREWFERLEFYIALWWIPAGRIPTVEEGTAKIELIRRLGPTPDAFTFGRTFPEPAVASGESVA